MPAKIGERKLKAKARDIVDELKNESAFKVILDMDDPQYCRMRAIEELQTRGSSEWAIMLLLHSICLRE